MNRGQDRYPLGAAAGGSGPPGVPSGAELANGPLQQQIAPRQREQRCGGHHDLIGAGVDEPTVYPHRTASRFDPVSVQATTWVWEHSTATGSARLVALAVADAANREGGESCQAISTLCQMTKLGESTIHRALKWLQDAGELRCEGANPRYAGALVYRFPAVMAGGPALAPPGPDPGEGGSRSDVEGGPDLGPNPKELTPDSQNLPPRASGGPPILALVASGDTAEPALFASDEVEKRATPEDTWPAEATANGCRQAWLVAFTDSHGPPDATIKRRAFGKVRDAARDRGEDLEAWRRLYRACSEAGHAGRWDVSAHLAPAPVSRYGSGNVHVHNALGMMDELLAQRPAIGGPA